MPQSVFETEMDPWCLEKGARTPSSGTPLTSRSTTSVARSGERPVEIPQAVLEALQAKGFEVDDKGTVRYAPDSPTHHRQRRLLRKVYDTALIFIFEFIVTLLSIAGSSIAPAASDHLGIGSLMSTFCLTTTYMLGQALGSLIFPPASESFGVKTIYVMSTFGYAICCFAIALWHNLAIVIIGRLGGGLFSAMPAASAGAIENLWDMTSRIFVVHIWIATAVLGLAVGPGVSTYLTLSSLGWTSIFWFGGGAVGVVGLLCLALKESRPSTVLRQEVKAVSERTGFSRLSVEEGDSSPTFNAFIRTSLLQPQRLFFTEPIVTLTAIMASTVYGVVYLFSECLDIVYVEEFGLSNRQASLVLLPIGVGVILSFLPRIYDVRVARSCVRDGTPWEPEHKLFGFYIAAPVLAFGLWWFSGTVPPLTHFQPWPSIMSLIFVGYSVTEFDNVLAGYLTDTYASYAASANASMSFLRCMMSGLFPLFGQQMFRGLGPNVALWLLASAASLFCLVAVVFRLYAKSIRHRSPLAEKTWSDSLSSKGVDLEKLRPTS